MILNKIIGLIKVAQAICSYSACFVASVAFIFASPAFADVEEAFESDYEHIEIIQRQIKNDNADINLYSQTIKIRNAFIRLTVGDDFSSGTIMYYSRIIATESLKNNIDPMLILAVVATESSFRYAVVSPVGAIGLMQLMPSTARYISEKTGVQGVTNWRQLFNAKTNISLGTAYLAYLINLTGNVEHALIAYNIGPTNLYNDIQNRYPLPMDYVRRVMSKYNEIKSFDNSDIFQ